MEAASFEARVCLVAFALFLRVSGFFAGMIAFAGDLVGAPVALARVGGTTIVGSAKAEMRRRKSEKSEFCRYFGASGTSQR